MVLTRFRCHCTAQACTDADVVAHKLRDAHVVIGDMDAASRAGRLHPGIMTITPAGGRYLTMDNPTVRAIFDVLVSAGVPHRQAVRFAFYIASL
jgi:hypothetical protein